MGIDWPSISMDGLLHTSIVWCSLFFMVFSFVWSAVNDVYSYISMISFPVWLVKKWKLYIFSLYVHTLVLEWTSKYQTSNTLNIECLNIELSEHHILAQNRTSNMSNITKTEQFTDIKLYVLRLVWSHNNRTELRILPNITFWPKTELRTCRTTQKLNSSQTSNCLFQD